MTLSIRKKVFWLFPALSIASTGAFAASDPTGIIAFGDPDAPDGGYQSSMTAAEQAAVEAYWTEDRMRNAIPMPAPQGEVVSDSRDPLAPDALMQQDEIGDSAGYAPGWDPNSDLPQPAWDEYVYLDETASLEGQDPNIQAQANALGTPPTDPLNGPYGPFQRRSLLGKYVNYPRSVIGKLFFTLNGSNYLCSGSVIGRSVVMTAGHCNYGNGSFATNRLFCPSYNQSGINPKRGCWTVINSKTNNLWQSTGDPDRDHACLITATSGTVHSTRIGDQTGWAGRAWNWGPQQPTEAFGYPAGSPFPGNTIVQASSPEWYEVDFSPASSSHKSKCTGNDMTGGSSGGPWYLSWNNPTHEVGDTDGNSATDPANAGGPHANGVNSHKRCIVNCNTPPTTTTGLFWQEMCSPPYRNTTGDTNESEDVFAVCYNNEP